MDRSLKHTSPRDTTEKDEMHNEATQLNANKQVIRQLFESVWNEGEFSGVENVWAQDVLFHFRGEQFPVSPGGLRKMVETWRQAFPDFRFTVEDLLAEGDRVAIRVKYTGTHTGAEWYGLPPTGRMMNVTEMMFFRLQNGKVAEAWEDYDEYVQRQQLGASL